MGLLFVLVSPCFRENVIVTCKIMSFFVYLRYFSSENVIGFFLLFFSFFFHFFLFLFSFLFFSFFFFVNQISKRHSFEKRFFDILFTFLVTRERYKNSCSTYLTYTHTHTHTPPHTHTPTHTHPHTHTYIAYLVDFFSFPILQNNANLSCMFCLCCVSWC